MSSRPLPPTSPLALLERLLAKLDLTATQQTDLARSYSAVTTALVNSDSLKDILLKLELRPQGSVRAGTVVKPSGDVPFDLDVLCWMEFQSYWRTPAQVWQLIWDALGESGVYRDMRTPKDRCVRLNFAAGYHLDITPSIPHTPGTEPKLFVPDRKRETWSASNPIGFCDSWFREITKKRPATLVKFSANSTIENREIVSKCETSVEELPDESGFEKAPLQRIVQLVKYLRDESYAFDDKHRPSSILLTTVTAHAYNAAVDVGHSSLREFVLDVLSALTKHVHCSPHDSGRFVVLNPVDDRENFADRWSLVTYQKFLSWCAQLHKQLSTLFNEQTQGLDGRLRLLEDAIPGARRFNIAQDIGREIRVTHDSGKLQLLAVPSVLGSATKVPPTANFGNP